MRKTIILAAIPALLLLCACTGVIGQTILQCSRPNTSDTLASFLVEPNTPGESALMRQAPHSVSRPSKHVLVVHWQGGVHQFKDMAPYMQGELDGLYWTYCGYSPKAGVHAIQKNDSDWLTGVLVDEKTGSILPGGFSVAFSPDMRHYITYEQEEGADLETIKLFGRAGKLLWSGPAGLLSPDGKNEISEFENLHWDGAGKLTVISKNLQSQQRETLVLTSVANGSWKWISTAAK